MRRRAGAWGSVAFVCVVLVLWVVFLRPTALGGPVNYVVVRGESMHPTFDAGALVLVSAQPAYRVGDAVAYHVPQGELGAGAIVVHRIVGQDTHGAFVVRGDNNPAPDPWRPQEQDLVGRIWLAIPWLGTILAFIRQPAVLGAAAAGLVVTGLLLRSPPQPGPVTGPPAAE